MREQLTEFDKCSNCESDVRAGLSYCPNCGLAVYARTGRGKPVSKLVLFGLAVFAIVFGIFGACGLLYALVSYGERGGINDNIVFGIGLTIAAIGFVLCGLTFWQIMRLRRRS